MEGGRSLIIHCGRTDRQDVIRAEPPSLTTGACYIHVATLDELRPMAGTFLAHINTEERARADRFRFEADRERFLLGHGWMRKLLSHYTGTPPAAIATVRGRFGKPALAEGGPYFNLSDTKDAVAFAVCDTVELGLDLETMDRRVDHDAVGAHYFTPEEQLTIARSEDQKCTFLELWTRKEAILKACGVGIMDDLRSLRVDEAVNPLTIRHAEFKAMAAPEYHVRTWRTDNIHLISLATPRPMDRILFFGA